MFSQKNAAIFSTPGNRMTGTFTSSTFASYDCQSGQYAETELYYYGRRYYSVALGRWEREE